MNSCGGCFPRTHRQNDCCGARNRITAGKNARAACRTVTLPVSYTHLDVYKRQILDGILLSDYIPKRGLQAQNP